MADLSDLITRLRKVAWSKDPEQWLKYGPALMDEAADALERLLKEKSE